VYIESGSRSASSVALVQQLHRDSTLPIIAMNPTGSKVLRAEVASGAFEAGKVVLPRRAHWLEVWSEEHANFPNAAHDDTVDTTSMAIAQFQQLAQSTGPVKVEVASSVPRPEGYSERRAKRVAEMARAQGMPRAR